MNDKNIEVDNIDFSTMTPGEIFFYNEGKKQGHKEAESWQNE